MHASRRLQAITSTVFAVALAMVPGMGSTTFAAAPGSGSGTEADPIVVRAFDLGFEPTKIEVAASGSVTLAMENQGAIQHDLTFPGGETTGAVDSAATGTVTVDVPAAGLDFWCSIPGHKEAGMAGHISVAGAAQPTPNAGGTTVAPVRCCLMPIRTLPPTRSTRPLPPRSCRERSMTTRSSSRRS